MDTQSFQSAHQHFTADCAPIGRPFGCGERVFVRIIWHPMTFLADVSKGAVGGLVLTLLAACSESGDLGPRSTEGPVPIGQTTGGTQGSGATSGTSSAGGSGGAGATTSTGGTSASGGAGTAGMSPGGTGGSGPGTGGTGADGGGGEGGADPCAGVVCDTPPGNTCADADNLTVFSSQGTCSNGGCSYSSSTTACPFGCASDACTGDPCIGVSCNSPPANFCANGSTLTVYDTPGTCDQGTCSYGTHDEFCANGCSGTGCMGDPCAGVTCNSPPASYCSGANELTVSDTPGTCNAGNGTCSYGNHTEFCSFGCENGGCAGDPCAGVSCNSAPASYCLDANTARTYTTPGTCSDGSCNYPTQDTPCSFGCINGVCRECNTGSDCGSAMWCNGGLCQNCDTDTACGASCTDCAASNQVCSNGSCVEPGCPPPTAACSNGTQNRKGCGGARIIGRPQAAAGFSTSDNTCNADWNFNESGGCWDANADHSYRLYMRAGETALARIDEHTGGCQGSWYASLNIYTNSGCGDTSCQQRITCDDSGDVEINYTAAYDGWHIFVVDGRHASDDEGEYTFTVTLSCNRPDCEC